MGLQAPLLDRPMIRSKQCSMLPRRRARNLCIVCKSCSAKIRRHSVPEQAVALVTELQQQLLMPQDSAQQIATAVGCDYAAAGMFAENISILSSLFPRSSMRGLEKLLLKNPAVLLAPLSAWNDFLAAYGVIQQAFCGIVQWQAGQIITVSTPFQAGTIIMALQNWGLSSSDINRSILLRCPQVLLLEKPQLNSLYSFLQDTCALPDTRIRDFVVAAPLVLLQDVQQQLQPRMASLQQALDADPAQLSSILQRLPGLLMADHATTIQPKLQQLHSFGFHGPELLQLVCDDPTVLTLSVTSMQRKWQFLTEQMGSGRAQVLQQCPTYFSKSLVTEVGPRYSFVTQRGLQANVACQPQQQQQGEPTQSNVRNSNCQQRPEQAQQQQPVQAQQQQQQMHLGKLLDPSIPEFLAMLGQAGAAAADYEAHAQHWAQTEGLKWTAVRVT